MKVPFTYTIKIYEISLNILVVFIVLILVEKLSKDYNSIKFSIFKRTCKHPKILNGNAALQTAAIHGLYE